MTGIISATRRRAVELLDYDANSGLFRWRVTRSRLAKIGSIAGNSSDGRYVQIEFDGRRYWAHRLAWLITYGSLPPIVDHINGCGTDNRILNLRAANKSLNAVNAKRSRTNTSGFRGVSFDRRLSKWRASIKVDGRSIHIGTFETRECAYAAYRLRAILEFGSFAEGMS